MISQLLPLRAATGIALSFIFVVACSKGGNDAPPTPPPPDCDAITVTASSTPSEGCSSSGTITATASGGSGFSYKLNSEAFQASNVFNNVAAGDHTITVKDANNCSKTATVKVTASTPGVLFAAVKSLVAANCVTCHSGPGANGGKDFSVECNIVANKDRIKARAIDGNPSFMPQGSELPQPEKDKIIAWLNAGGRFND